MPLNQLAEDRRYLRSLYIQMTPTQHYICGVFLDAEASLSDKAALATLVLARNGEEVQMLHEFCNCEKLPQ